MRTASEHPTGGDGRDASLTVLGQSLVVLLALLLAVVVSLLPQAWRRRFNGHLPLLAGTVLSAALQSVISLLYITGRLHHESRMLEAAGHTHSAWLVMACVYFIMEAGVRLLSAVAVNEPLGTLPLWLVERAPHWIRIPGRKRRRATPDPAAASPLPRARLLRRWRR